MEDNRTVEIKEVQNKFWAELPNKLKEYMEKNEKEDDDKIKELNNRTCSEFWNEYDVRRAMIILAEHAIRTAKDMYCAGFNCEAACNIIAQRSNIIELSKDFVYIKNSTIQVLITLEQELTRAHSMWAKDITYFKERLLDMQ